MADDNRYECWAGVSHENYLDVMVSILDCKGDEIWRKKVKEMRFESIWPIVDKKTAGSINGYPRPNQICAFAFDSNTQREVCDALNLQDKLRRMGEAGKRSTKCPTCQTEHLIGTMCPECYGDSLGPRQRREASQGREE